MKFMKIFMKRLIFLLLACLSMMNIDLFAQNRTKVADGVYLATYGNVTVIENDNTQQSVQIKVVKSDSMYDILCGNTVVKTVAKVGLVEGITFAVQSYTLIPKWVTKTIVGDIVNKIYDGVCDYYR